MEGISMAERQVTLAPIPGFEDRTGYELKLCQYIAASLNHTFQLHGFGEIQTPVVERAGTFGGIDENPARQREMFCFDHHNYQSDGHLIEKEPVVLRPEGTAPVCRHLAYLIATGGAEFPLKFFYTQPMFRNEPADQLSRGKRRMFYQSGVEFLQDAQASPEERIATDAEVCNIAYRGLFNLGFSKNSVNIRLNDIRLFDYIVTAIRGTVGNKEVSLKVEDPSTGDYVDSTMSYRPALKKVIDGISVSRIIGDDYQLRINLSNLESILTQLNIRGRLKKAIELVAEVAGIETSVEDFQKRISEPKLSGVFDEQRQLSEYLAMLGVPHSFDFGVVRGLDIYSGGIVMQVDMVRDRDILAEVAGGGRYDELVGNFLRERAFSGTDEQTGVEVPASGFAYGLDRVVNAAMGSSLFEGESPRGLDFFVDEKPIDVIVYSKDFGKSLLEANEVRYAGSDRVRAEADLTRGNEIAARKHADSIGAEFLVVDGD